MARARHKRNDDDDDKMTLRFMVQHSAAISSPPSFSSTTSLAKLTLVFVFAVWASVHLTIIFLFPLASSSNTSPCAQTPQPWTNRTLLRTSRGQVGELDQVGKHPPEANLDSRNSESVTNRRAYGGIQDEGDGPPASFERSFSSSMNSPEAFPRDPSAKDPFRTNPADLENEQGTRSEDGYQPGHAQGHVRDALSESMMQNEQGDDSRDPYVPDQAWPRDEQGYLLAVPREENPADDDDTPESDVEEDENATSPEDAADDEHGDAMDEKAIPSSHRVDERAGIPFVSLEMCGPQHGKYYCEGNHDCINRICMRNGTTMGIRSSKLDQFYEQVHERRYLLRSIIERMQAQRGKSNRIMVFIVNAGFAHLFANWYCTLRASGADDAGLAQLQAESLILATDVQAETLIRELGFFTPTVEEFQALTKWTDRMIMPNPAIQFGRGSHQTLNLILKFAMPLDLISLNAGFDFIGIFDVDLIWRTTTVFEIMIERCMEHDCDLTFIHEGRSFEESEFVTFGSTNWLRGKPRGDEREKLPEFNTGMILLRATSENTQEVLKTLMEGHHLQRWKGRDQPLWNSVVYHRAFESLKVHLLPVDEFIPGFDLHFPYWKNPKKNPLVIPATRERIRAIHVSDTGSYRDKIAKMKAIGVWTFTEEQCPSVVTICKQMKECWQPVEGYTKESMPKYLDENDPEWLSNAPRLLQKGQAT